jgi:hypothetical protein
MRHLSRLLPGAALSALILCLASVTATAAVHAKNGNGDDHGNGNGNGNGAATSPAAASTPPGQAKKTTPAAPTTPPGQAKNDTTPAAPATPPGQAKKTTPTNPATPATPADPATGTPATPATPAAPTPVPVAVAPVVGESMGLKPVAGAVQVRLPQSTGYVSLAAAGSIPSGAVIDARQGTVVLRSAIDASGHTQAATIRGAIFEVRQSASGKGLTDLVLRGGRPQGCPATAAAAAARAAMAHSLATKAKKPAAGGLWARDRHGRFRTRGRNSVATVRGTRWVTRETCAGTLTRVMEGAVDVFDKRTHRTVRVRAGHSYLARTSA